VLRILATDDVKVPFPPHDRTPIAELFHATPNLHAPDCYVPRSQRLMHDSRCTGPGDGGSTGKDGRGGTGGWAGDDGLSIGREEGTGGADGAGAGGRDRGRSDQGAGERGEEHRGGGGFYCLVCGVKLSSLCIWGVASWPVDVRCRLNVVVETSRRSRYRVWNGHVAWVDARVLYVIVAVFVVPRIPDHSHSCLSH
jgi:hypothetical protein